MELIKRFLEGHAPPAQSGDFSTQLCTEEEAANRPLEPSLQKHDDIVTRFAEEHDLEITTWDGNYFLRKDYGGIPSEVVGIRDNGDGIIQIDVYVGGERGFLSPALYDLLVPVKEAGDEAILIDRAAAHETSAGEIILDTRELSQEKLEQLMLTSRLRQKQLDMRSS